MTREEAKEFADKFGSAICEGFKDGINNPDKRVMQAAKDKASHD
jgi:hypothetical protein